MISLSKPPPLFYRASLNVLLPMALWAMLWISIAPGDPNQILKPDNLSSFIHGIRSVSPFLAGFLALAVISYKLIHHQPRGFRLFGPLALTFVYGLVGVASSLLSPNTVVALRWVAVYLAVPVVLWAVVWETNMIAALGRLINMTWLVITLGVFVLFAVGVMELGLADVLTHPERLIECVPGGWYDFTSGRLRDTGVGRYAAIAAIIAISRLWQRDWPLVSILVLLTAVVLLMFSGARGAFGGFAAGATLVVLINGGKKALVAGSVAVILMGALAWSTGFHDKFVDICIFRVGASSPVSPESVDPQQTLIPSKVAQLSQASAKSPSTMDASSQNPVTTIELAQEQATPKSSAESSSPNTPQSSKETPVQEQALLESRDPEIPPVNLQVPPGATVVGRIPTQDETVSDATVPQQLPTGEQASPQSQVLPNGSALEQVPPGQSLPEQASSSEQATAASSSFVEILFKVPLLRRIPQTFFTFTGRSPVWADGWKLFKQSPLVGYGFHADRLLLGTHMHNSVMHALIQTGLIGTIAFIGAVLFGWLLFLGNLRNITRLPLTHKRLVIQTGAVLAFLTMRALPESTGAFFGVDWLILAPILLYLQLMNRSNPILPIPSFARRWVS